MSKKILINALGINDSGGISVFSKLLEECLDGNEYSYYIVCNHNDNIAKLVEKYKKTNSMTFSLVSNRGIIYRLWYENIFFRSLIKRHKISLVYNFTGSGQLFLKAPQITKVHNLLFYSKPLDNVYFSQKKYWKWLKQIFFKRLVFLFLLRKVKYIEIQASHVVENLADFLRVENKAFFVKSDILIEKNHIKSIHNYDFSKKLFFLYIVGPHFSLPHKNFKDFVNAMTLLLEEKIDFSIKITLTQNELENSGLWDKRLNDNTEFLGYIKEKKNINALFDDNSILISTSVVETIGLHVVEAISNGVLAIVPNEKYAMDVYGKDILMYTLFDHRSLVNKILEVLLYKNEECFNIISTNQDYLLKNEDSKYNNIIEIFDKLLKGGANV